MKVKVSVCSRGSFGNRVLAPVFNSVFSFVHSSQLPIPFMLSFHRHIFSISGSHPNFNPLVDFVFISFCSQLQFRYSRMDRSSCIKKVVIACAERGREKENKRTGND